MRVVDLPMVMPVPTAVAIVPRGDGSAVVYEVGDALPGNLVNDGASPRVISVAEFRDRFTAAELAAIAALAYSGGGDQVMQVLLLKLATNRDGVDLDDTSVREGLAYLVTRGVLEGSRVDQIVGGA